ncbi:ParB-like nuclease domain protein [Arthrobacter phage Pureglobe5]|nr:ParB-like nuclease domain protein [Arthrobacter phage Beagle]QOP66766.1 ParB-like nuclease domain protein [Arthrobacter phage Odyssey395]UYL87379.1 ParB-like nuclease domain protein [Arthrobacter phage Pureglobe5]
MRAVNFVEDVRDKLVPIGQVKQHPDNPNNGDVEKLIESIQVNGFYTTITADRQTGYILAGNHRYQALHALGATHIPVVWVDKDRHGTLRILVGDNATGKLAEVDKSGQAQILRELMESNVGIAGTGFDVDSYQRLLEQLLMDQQQIPTPEGFGAGTAPSGIYQVVIDFDNPDERDELFADLAERFEGVRTVNL